MQMNALRSANFAKLSSSSSTSDEYWVRSISAGTPAGYCLSQIRSMVFPLWLFPCFLAGHACFGQYCECRRRWQAAACYRRIAVIWNNSAERQENRLITWLRGPLTSRLAFALGFSGSLRLGRIRRGLVSGGDDVGVFVGGRPLALAVAHLVAQVGRGRIDRNQIVDGTERGLQPAQPVAAEAALQQLH